MAPIFCLTQLLWSLPTPWSCINSSYGTILPPIYHFNSISSVITLPWLLGMNIYQFWWILGRRILVCLALVLSPSHGLILSTRIPSPIHLDSLFSISDQLGKSTISNIYFVRVAHSASDPHSASLTLPSPWDAIFGILACFDSYWGIGSECKKGSYEIYAVIFIY